MEPVKTRLSGPPPHFLGLTVMIVGVLLFGGCGREDGQSAGFPFSGRTIVLYIGSASQPPVESIIDQFEQATGATCIAHYGGSGAMLAQLEVTKRGDVYFPGSSDYMALAVEHGLVDEETVKPVAYLVPAICVGKGNPKDIRSLADLAREDVRVGLARPDSVCVGLYAVETLEQAGLWEAVKPQVAAYVQSCAQTAQAVSLGTVDAVVGWRVFAYWSPDTIETVALEPRQVPRLGTIPAGVTTCASDVELAQAFLDYVSGPQGTAAFATWHYLATETEARQWAEADTPVGGQWALPEDWDQ